MNRREFLMLTCATTVCAAASGLVIADGDGAAGMVDAGPASNFAAEGVYSNFRDLGFFVVRRDGKLLALSSICPHRKVKLIAEHDCSFYCKRHGSTFDPSGHVTEGPAKHDMPVLATSVNAAGHLLVTVPVA